MKLISVIAITLFTTLSHATMYFAAYDESSKAIGLAYSSSGGNFWQTRVKGKGLVAAQAYGLCQEATPKEFLEQGLSAKEVAKKLFQQCHDVGWEKYRLAAITVDGAIASVIAAEGCTSENESCGEIYDKDFLIIGGGLVNGVLAAGRKHYFENAPTDNFACRLYSTLKAVYAAGGEKKEFAGASIVIDNPKNNQLLVWEARGEEKDLLPTLQKKMKAAGFDCK